MFPDLFKLHMVTAGNSTWDLWVRLMLVVTGKDRKSETKLARLLTVMSEKKANMTAQMSILIFDLALAALLRPAMLLSWAQVVNICLAEILLASSFIVLDDKLAM